MPFERRSFFPKGLGTRGGDSSEADFARQSRGESFLYFLTKCRMIETEPWKTGVRLSRQTRPGSLFPRRDDHI